MSSFNVRPYEPRDQEGFGHVRSRVYRGGDPVLPDDRLLRDDSLGFVIESGGTIIGAATVLDMTCSRQGEMHRCGGIAAVAVLPEWRGSGAGSVLMRGMNDQLPDHGFEVASLHPFSDRWYARFGYVGLGVRLAIRCPAHQMPAFHNALPVREISAADWRHLEPVCKHFARTYNGYNLRTPDQWWRTLGGDTPLAVYVVGDPVEAYAVIRLRGDFWVDQEVREFLWTTDRGYQAMLALFKSLAMNKTAVTWTEPFDSPFCAHYLDRGSKVEWVPPIMFRKLGVDESIAAETTRNWLGPTERVYCTDAF